MLPRQCHPHSPYPPAGGQVLEPTAFPFPGGAGSPSTTTGQVLPEQSRGPKLSEQLDMLTELFAERRQADLERRGLFLHPEVF